MICFIIYILLDYLICFREILLNMKGWWELKSLKLSVPKMLRSALREDYGPNVTGLDYGVEGLGEFAHITHVEVKGADSTKAYSH